MKHLLTSRQFWVAIFALIVVIIAAFVPEFQLDTENAAAMAGIIFMYLLGVTVDPGPGGWRGVLLSRKFWAAVVGLTMIFLDAFHVVLPFALTPDTLILLAVTIGGYIASAAIEPKPETEAQG